MKTSPIRLLLAAAAVLTCARNPATGKREIMLVSESQEVAIGKENDPQIVAQMGLVPDERIQRYVSGLGMSLAKRSERPDLPWTFRVLDDPTVNAFALPGGFIYITRGIMAHMNSEAELITVLGHEVGHVTARHSASQMSKQQLAQLGLVAGVLVEPQFAKYAETASQAMSLLFLKFGRDDEREADGLGLRYMMKTGHDPREAPHVFEMLARVSAASPSGDIPSWLSSHPDPEDRRGWMERAVSGIPADSLGRTINREGYLQYVDGLVYGVDPREGFFNGGTFFHPGLKFRLQFPQGWQTTNQKQFVAAMSQQQDGVVQLQIDDKASSVEAAARSFFSQQGLQGQPGSARINGMPAQVGEFRVQLQDGRQLGGFAAFVSFGGAIYRIMGYATVQMWGQYGRAVVQTVESFQQINDPSILRIQPQHVTVVTIPRAMTLAQFFSTYPGPITIKELARLNNVDEGARFAAGERVKRVVGDRLGVTP